MQLLTHFPTSTVETKFEMDKKSSTKHNTIPCANLILRLMYICCKKTMPKSTFPIPVSHQITVMNWSLMVWTTEWSFAQVQWPSGKNCCNSRCHVVDAFTHISTTRHTRAFNCAPFRCLTRAGGQLAACFHLWWEWDYIFFKLFLIWNKYHSVPHAHIYMYIIHFSCIFFNHVNIFIS